MKTNTLKVTLLSLLFITFLPGFQCKKAVVENRISGCIKGKLVVKGPCAQNVIQVISGDTRNVVIAANWLDPETNTNYANVFTVENYCFFPSQNVGDEFNFYFIRDENVSNCIVCGAIRATPTEKNEVEYIGTTCP
jgi:hypothetical protein